MEQANRPIRHLRDLAFGAIALWSAGARLCLRGGVDHPAVDHVDGQFGTL